MINQQHKCIFIHIPKTGGTSIEKKLGHFRDLRYGVQDHRNIREIRPRTFFDKAGLLFSRNSHFSRIQFLRAPLRSFRHSERTLSKEQFDNYFKFAFVRNPWDRMHSWYCHVMRVEEHKRDMKLSDDCSFKEFILDHQDVNYGFLSQLHWIEDYGGSIPLDFIGRFESLQKDFDHVAERIGLPNSNLPHLLKRKNLPYIQAYDSELRDFVANHFEREIRLFGYTFDGQT